MNKNIHIILNINFINSTIMRPNGNLILPIVILYLSNSFKSGIPSWSKSIENKGSINKLLSDFKKLLVWLPNIHTINDVITVVFIIKFLSSVTNFTELITMTFFAEAGMNFKCSLSNALDEKK
mgnify:CR=1 FL=1